MFELRLNIEIILESNIGFRFEMRLKWGNLAEYIKKIDQIIAYKLILKMETELRDQCELKEFKVYEGAMIALLVAAFLWELFILVVTIKFLKVFRFRK